PMVKAHRSTASNRNAVDGFESMLADINPYGSPNSIIPDNGYIYERKYFEERTIPAWVGYLLLGDQKNDPTLYEKALEEYLYCINAPGYTPQEKLDTANILQKKLDRVDTLEVSQEHMSTRDFLYQEAHLHKELPEHKIAQDIYWAGHSLGGGLSQFGIYYHGTRRNRIPLQGCTFYCYSSRAPAIDTSADEAFMTFGRKHKQLITELNGQRWKVKHDFEYGDFVPEGGNSHLGTTGYVEELDADWLDEEITIFKPSETAQDPDITTHCTHGRRTGKALEGRDFTVKKMSVQELSDFDHSWWMTADLIETFGYRILRSSKIAEYVREIFAQITYPFWHIIVQVYNYIWPPFGQRDNKNNWNLNYVPPT
ncbi:MAG: hypothetical protein JSR46_09530, partial [Verrucomicrobia bacterium]|nr:hypothetical protein [Verrucomicrobiota bacterium]